MLHNTESVYYDRVVHGFVKPNYSLILGNIKVGDRVRLIKLSTDAVAGFPAEGIVIDINLHGMEQRIEYNTFTNVNFDVSADSSTEQGVYKVRDAWLMKLSACHPR